MVRSLLALTLFLAVTQTVAAAVIEPAYNALGTGNSASGFTIPVKINSAEIAAIGDLHAQVQYAPLHSSAQLQDGPFQKISVGHLPGASFFAINVTGLQETTMYRARVNLYRASGVHLGTSAFYYTTTTGNDPKSLIRTRMVLKGLKEFYDSELGLVGKGGTVAVDGTRYGADVGEAWCSEFYSWVATGSLKNIAGIGHFANLMEYFRVHPQGFYNRSAVPTVARRGDYLAMDTDDTLGTNHSGMFLAFEKANDGEYVWTLEGNSGKKVRVNRRPFDDTFTALGHIVHGMY